MPTKRGITIFFVPHNRKEPLSFHLEGWQVTAGIIVGSLAVLLFVIGIVMGGRSIKLLAKNRSLRTQNESFRRERVKIANLERELSETGRMRRWMEGLIDMGEDEPEPRARTAFAIGEEILPIIDRPFETRLLPELESKAAERKRRLDFIPRTLPVKGSITARFGEMGQKFLSPHTGVDIAASVAAS